MRILVLAPDVPATSRMPGSPRLFSLSRELSRRHELSLFTYRSSHERYQSFLNDPTLPNVYARIEILPAPPGARWLGQQWHRLHLAAHFETRYRHASYFRSIRDRVREFCVRQRIELIYVDILPMTQYVDPRMNIPAIVDLHDSLTLLYQRMLGAERDWRKRLSTHLGLIGVKRLERSVGEAFDLVITNSAIDEQSIRELSANAKTLTIANGVDMDYFAPDSSLPEADKIVFTGVMDYAPNEDAALHFGEDIFPLVRARCPQAQFWIVGSNPSDRVRRMTRAAGIHVTGLVDDVRPHVRSATVFVSPLRVGSGVKNKVLAAMAMGKAVVASPLSIDGLDLADNREVLLAQDPKSFADKVVRLLVDQQERQRLGTSGLACVRGKYSWQAMGQSLENAMRSVVSSKAPRTK
jgi:sugar transferase (PEP-CTERM/EpsH1 system associated)